MHTRTCSHTHTHTHTHTHARSHMFACTHTHTHTTHTHTHTCTHAHMHTQTHTHTQTHLHNLQTSSNHIKESSIKLMSHKGNLKDSLKFKWLRDLIMCNLGVHHSVSCHILVCVCIYIYILMLWTCKVFFGSFYALCTIYIIYHCILQWSNMAA